MIDQTTMTERYTRAMNSSHLEVIERRTGDVDVIIAAGWVPDHLGTTLQRLAAEYDQARGDVVNARRHAAENNLEATRMEREEKSYRRAINRLSKERDAPAIDSLTRMADALHAGSAELRAAGEAAILSARAMILLELKTLARARAELFEWAQIRAMREKFMRPGPMPSELGPAHPRAMRAWRDKIVARNNLIAELAGRMLDVLLDDLCANCQGRGFNGGVSRTDPQIICRTCGGSGNRLETMGKTREENDFALSLLTSVQILLNSAERSMRASLSAKEPA